VSELKALRNQRVLDIGCSIGMMLSELDESNEKYGFDINEQAIRRAQELNPDAQLFCHSMFDRFPYSDDMFDSIVVAHVWKPYNDQDRIALGEIYRVLKPGGTLYLTMTNKNHVMERHSYPKGIFYGELARALQIFKHVMIYGWNPLPSFVFFLPKRLTDKIPTPYWKFLFIPSPLLARIPYIMDLFRWLMTKQWLLKYSKALYAVAIK
jgi:ubiquinone/menaquinone biosynthesis C-methylase UbiE